MEFLEQAITCSKRTLNFRAKSGLLENKDFFADEIYNQQLLVLILTLLNSPEKDSKKLTGL